MVRVKHRYLVLNYLYPTTEAASSNVREALPGPLQFHQPTPDDFNEGRLIRAIQDGVAEIFGNYGVGMVSTGLKVNYHSTATSTSIVRCPQAHYEMVWAALTFMTRLPKPVDIPVVVKVVRVSGTIRKAEEEIIKRAKEIVLRARFAESGAGNNGLIQDIVKVVEKRRETEVLAVADEDENDDHSESE